MGKEHERERQELRRLEKLVESEARQAELAEQERAKDEAAKCRAEKFLKGNGFKGDINSKKRFLMLRSHKYALHVAVEKNDVESIDALLRCKADPTLQNSSRKTPEQLAVSINKCGSHDKVLARFR